MRATRLGPRDVTATVVVSAAAAYYAAHQAGANMIGTGSARAVASVVLVLGLIGCATGADAEALQHGINGLPLRVLSLLGGAALVVGLLALALGSDVLVTTLFSLTVTLWFGATLRHLFREPPTGDYPESTVHDLIKTGR